MSHFLVYVRRSYRPNGAPDVSDETQVEAAVALLPAGASHEVIADSGGHHSGRDDRRDGYRELIRRIEAGGIAGVAVYDLSRLARNAQLMLTLKAALDKRNVAVLLSNMPTTRFDTAVGKFMFGQLALASELQANLDSERAVALNRHAFEDGRHRGLPPRGYRNGKDPDTNRRTLEVDPDAARRVVQIVELLARHSYGEVSRILTVDGYPMTTAAVKDVARRLRVYLGFVVRGRGLDERPGRHAPLITEDEYRAAIAGIRMRTRVGARSRQHRVYVLAGVLLCGCGGHMTGEARTSRGRDWRYYRCRACDAPMVPADPAETAVLDELAALPPLTRRTIERADQEQLDRVTRPVESAAAKQRDRLERRLVQLRKQHSWGELTDAQFRSETAETRADLARLPDPAKLIAFTATRRLIESFGEMIAAGGPAEHQRLVRLAVESVVARDRVVVEVELAAAIQDALWLRRPRTVSGSRQPREGIQPPIADL